MTPRGPWWQGLGPGDEQAPAELEADEECPDCLGRGFWCATYPDGTEYGPQRLCTTCDGDGHVSWEREWAKEDEYDALDESALSAMEAE